MIQIYPNRFIIGNGTVRAKIGQILSTVEYAQNGIPKKLGYGTVRYEHGLKCVRTFFFRMNTQIKSLE